MYLSCPASALGRLAILALLTAVGGVSSARAEDPGLAAARRKMLLDYRLTVEKVDKIGAVSKKLAAAERANPQIGREIHVVDAEKGGTFAQIDEEFAKLAPHVAALIRSEGLGPGDYFIGMTSTVNASMEAAGLLSLPDYIPRANVELAKKYQAKFDAAVQNIDELNAAYKALGQ